jgi:alanine racemase
MKLPSALNVENLKPVLSLWASKISSRELRAGERVGYGGDYKATGECVVGNYDFGYGDGFLRACACGYKTPNATELVGRVSMDNSTFMSSDDKLLIFDDARDAASYAKTISYEVLTSLKPEIKRTVI